MTSLFDNVDIVKSSKTFRIPFETMLQHSIFDRKRQIYLLKDVNRSADNLVEFRGCQKTLQVRAWVSDFTMSTVIMRG